MGTYAAVEILRSCLLTRVSSVLLCSESISYDSKLRDVYTVAGLLPLRKLQNFRSGVTKKPVYDLLTTILLSPYSLQASSQKLVSPYFNLINTKPHR